MPDVRGNGLPIAGIVGLLAALGIAGAGAMAMRARRRRDQDDGTEYAETAPAPAEYDEVEYEGPDAYVEPHGQAGNAALTPAAVYTPDPVLAPTPVIPAPAMGAASMTERATADAEPARADSDRARPGVTSASAVLEASPLPQTAEERRDLLDRMVDAEPDEANPFTSRKARMRRARVQLQSRETAQEQGGAFDWRAYRTEAKPETGPETGSAVPEKAELTSV